MPKEKSGPASHRAAEGVNTQGVSSCVSIVTRCHATMPLFAAARACFAASSACSGFSNPNIVAAFFRRFNRFNSLSTSTATIQAHRFNQTAWQGRLRLSGGKSESRASNNLSLRMASIIVNSSLCMLRVVLSAAHRRQPVITSDRSTKYEERSTVLCTIGFNRSRWASKSAYSAPDFHSAALRTTLLDRGFSSAWGLNGGRTKQRQATVAICGLWAKSLAAQLVLVEYRAKSAAGGPQNAGMQGGCVDCSAQVPLGRIGFDNANTQLSAKANSRVTRCSNIGLTSIPPKKHARAESKFNWPTFRPPLLARVLGVCGLRVSILPKLPYVWAECYP